MKTIFAILRLYWQHYPGWFMAGIGIAYVTALASITLMATAGWFLGATALAGVTGAVVFNTVYPGFLIRTAALTRMAGKYAERVITHDATFRFLARLRLYVFDGISQLPFRRLHDFRSGELLARLTADIDALDGIYLRVILPLSTAVLTCLALIFILHGFNAPIAFAAGGILLLALIILPIQAGKVGVRLGRRIAFTSEALRLRYIDLLRGQMELVMAGRIGDQVSSITKAASRIRDLQAELAAHDLKGRALITLAGGAALVVTLAMGALAFEAGNLSGPMVLLAVLSVFAMAELLVPIRRGLLDIGRVLYAGQRILPLMAEPEPLPEPCLFDLGPVTLKVDDVRFAYSKQAAPIINDLSFNLQSGEAIGIIGGSGAGKSTLLSLVAGLLDPQDGGILLRYDTYQDGRKPRLGLLTQRTELFRESLRENLILGAPDASSDELDDAVEKAQLKRMIERLPNGLEQILGDEGLGLSGGESRRMALARLLLYKPDLWLLDEMTEGLDKNTAQAVLETLREATKNKALLFVTHKQAEAELADKLLVFEDGQSWHIVERDQTDEWDRLVDGLR
ncbi:thiol reductant ABC exporter subunit CydC [Cohaesibacter gelatinilyticus]|uniref:ATP-binding cassette, subfamily C, CydC n=1 Tax=Cohaesibacter gelatinilyticus TaxID=372072 RepID=A0A285NCC9_9HYPH|nr:thiol reductant ABC exporter subunit CydC [Cohaesibacter gelatinilyticus]SNZ06938.1 ATP-binding cassette, subfamily C, CydC [Cohaesibacter gelatinilyticus]